MRIRKTTHIMQIAGLCAALVSSSACVATSTAAAPVVHILHTKQLLTLSLAQANSAVASASHGRAHVLKVFPGPDGLIGAVIEGPSKTLGIAWLTPHGNAVLSGDMLIGPGGTDLNKEAMFSQGLLLRPAPALEQAAAPAARGILVGTTGPRITVFFDPNCIYCHRLYLDLAPQVAAGKVRVRYVIVGVLKESSLPRAASILAAKHPVQALNLDEADFDVKTEEGGYPVASALDPALKRGVEANNRLFSRAGFDGTPTILYCAKATKDVQVLTGIPTDIMTFVASAGDGAAKACE
ncbi:MAG: thioredoxin fold domain-containing protein [Gammaproteobacteria bacterium]